MLLNENPKMFFKLKIDCEKFVFSAGHSKRRFIAQSHSCSPFHRLEMTEILLKERKTLTHPSILYPCIKLFRTFSTSLWRRQLLPTSIHFRCQNAAQWKRENEKPMTLHNCKKLNALLSTVLLGGLRSPRAGALSFEKVQAYLPPRSTTILWRLRSNAFSIASTLVLVYASITSPKPSAEKCSFGKLFCRTARLLLRLLTKSSV